MNCGETDSCANEKFGADTNFGKDKNFRALPRAPSKPLFFKRGFEIPKNYIIDEGDGSSVLFCFEFC